MGDNQDPNCSSFVLRTNIIHINYQNTGEIEFIYPGFKRKSSTNCSLLLGMSFRSKIKRQ
jgi:hypothetical protein